MLRVEHGSMTLKQAAKIIPIKLRFALQGGHDNFPIITKNPSRYPGLQ
jgi:hypothetical protein